ncbi:LacI family transcriptional regulator [Motiliproteus sp. MSK22-1]|nr:LacI family transcriptional regulator [Motiliproteus sp. MSK22-1]
MTVTEVAAEAGVSISAVSRAFNPNASCSEKMKQKVFAAADKLDYRPNRLARGLKSNSSLIGILMTDFENPAYLSILDDFTTAIQQRNCHSLLINASQQMSIAEAVELVMQYHVDGLIVTSATLPQALIDACQAQNTPVVIFGRHSAESIATVVCSDNVANGRMAADLLLDAGYQRPAFVGGTVAASTTTDRQRGFIGRLIERGCEHWFCVEGGRHSYDAGFDATCKLFNSADKPDSIFYVDDIMACGGMDAIRYELGLRVPEDIGVIGVDDIRLAHSRAYSLTTIRQPFTDMVNTTVEALFEHIQDPTLEARQITVPCSLITRNSTRAAKKN